MFSKANVDDDDNDDADKGDYKNKLEISDNNNL